ncbi:hypothetical protein ACFZBU_16685 [Embleya sp. NPDC008237]|uniref:hypothetical protein n=1 Tax=Embleya sp. NPDC008237 TaxID=3363978 RepID=UPI0036EA2E75
MSEQAVTYVRRLGITDHITMRVFLVLAEHTGTTNSLSGAEIPEVMGLDLAERDLPRLAAETGLDVEAFRRELRALKRRVPMDILEHDDGTWEIVYGPSYTDPPPPVRGRAVVTDENVGGPHVFSMPGWNRYSTWGYDRNPDCLYAQIIRNEDDPDARPRIWITPPAYCPKTIDELARAIAEAMVPYSVVPPPAELIKDWLTKPRLS